MSFGQLLLWILLAVVLYFILKVGFIVLIIVIVLLVIYYIYNIFASSGSTTQNGLTNPNYPYIEEYRQSYN